MKKPAESVVQSIHDRLKNKARERGESFNFVLIRFGLERLIYRLSQSKFKNRFVLKGALLFEVWSEVPHRSTKDIDLSASGVKSPAKFERIFKEVCATESNSEDGLIFIQDSVSGEYIRSEHAYGGVRIRLTATLGDAKIPLQIDIGIGDIIVPKPEEIEYPSLLGMTTARIRAYHQETTIAEKFHAMVNLGIANSRMKDYYDIYYLTNEFSIDGKSLKSAIKATFQGRKTIFPQTIPLALSEDFYQNQDKQHQWYGFISKLGFYQTEISLEDVVNHLALFFKPVIRSIISNSFFHYSWDPKKTKWIK